MKIMIFGICDQEGAATRRVLVSESNHVFVSEPQCSGKTLEDYNVFNVFKRLMSEATLDEFCAD